jgi:hypothetical protein
MKKIILSLAVLLTTGGLFAQSATEAPKKKADEVGKFKSDVIEMGKIKQDNPTTAVFEVTNISNEPLIIEQANPTCGCTIGDYTKEPIAPGKSGTIKATYNAKNIGIFEKRLSVKFAGIDEIKSITIKGEVIKTEETASAPSAAPATPAKTEIKAEKAAAVAKDKAPAKKSKAKQGSK